MKQIFSKKQVIGCVVLACMLVLTIVLLFFLPRWIPTATQEYDLTWSDSAVHRIEQNLKDIQRDYAWERRDTVPLHLAPFDPNQADSLTFRRLGMPAWMAHNILRYRAKGGQFRTAASFRKVYGMTEERYQQLLPYIQIDTTLLVSRRTFTNQQDSTRTTRVYKQKKDTILELNSADTAQLQLIRGIGRYTAMQIVRYRQQLGGYVSTDQLREIADLPTEVDSLLPYFVVNTDSIRPLAVNRSKVEWLQRHPYLTFTQAKALYTLRREKFRLHSMDDLRGLGCFTEQDLQRLEPYLTFE